MTAPIVYADTRRPQFFEREFSTYLSDADRRARKGWKRPAGQLWERLAERAEAHT